MASRIGWTKRRARRLQHAFKVSRRVALVSANDDWLAFRGLVKRDTAARSCDALGVCQLHATGEQRCDACPYKRIPMGTPPLARSGWRQTLRALGRWLMEPTPW